MALLKRPLWALLLGALLIGYGVRDFILLGFIGFSLRWVSLVFVWSGLRIAAGVWILSGNDTVRRKGLVLLGLCVALAAGERVREAWRTHAIVSQANRTLAAAREQLNLSQRAETLNAEEARQEADRRRTAAVLPANSGPAERLEAEGFYTEPRNDPMTADPLDRLTLTPADARSLLAQHHIPDEPAEFVRRAGAGDLRAVKLFLKSGMAVDARDASNDTALTKAIDAPGRASWDGNKAVIETLVKAGADVNVRDRFGMTPLMACALSRYKAPIPLLISAGADLQAKDSGGRTILEAVTLGKDDDMAQLLRQYGAR